MPNAEYRQTDYGFVLLHYGHIEIFGMIGQGFYELVESCSHGGSDSNIVEEMLRQLESEHCNKLDVCRTTKTNLS